MTKNLLLTILDKCRLKLPDHPQYECFPHWSFLIRNNQIISWGTNKEHEPDRKYGYHNKEKDESFKPKLHSELDCVRKNRRGFEDTELVNIRLNKSGIPRLALPCKICRNLILSIGIKKIYFTHENGWGNI